MSKDFSGLSMVKVGINSKNEHGQAKVSEQAILQNTFFPNWGGCAVIKRLIHACWVFKPAKVFKLHLKDVHAQNGWHICKSTCRRDCDVC